MSELEGCKLTETLTSLTDAELTYKVKQYLRKSQAYDTAFYNAIIWHNDEHTLERLTIDRISLSETQHALIDEVNCRGTSSTAASASRSGFVVDKATGTGIEGDEGDDVLRSYISGRIAGSAGPTENGARASLVK